ncbi:Subunit beta1 of the nascent polypeptide-associated complex (NAC) involved in protein targeting [Komagataella phaffii GS115]|uniref:Nascent polypeptide-associated complex subunit beta n=1 Tax=Komagataella phaffii (strain GS115 / ATCC 20864) TaxID=644223 RepID=C4QVG1_KOMPG|nr:Subunit beta1 of the nascent polypeptide-associated complex (NAC) involved in protein targeting [Komagataella phaffii GS115]CAY67234.1 Subunit beta1 of the nascent polypeptide-associated complex (NAC) involved in protein targeting [Komagataella phaffii GS115]
MPIDQQKLEKLQKSGPRRVGGARLKQKRSNRDAEADDTKLQATLQKFNVQTLTGVEEANFFKDDGKVLHFNRVGVQAAANYNTYAFTGYAQEKNITDLIPGILPQLGAENLQFLQQIAESLQKNPDALNALKNQNQEGAEAEDDSEIPELVEGETFDKNID